MRTVRKVLGGQTLFIISELDPTHHEAANHLFYQPVEGGFAKAYPADTPHLDRIYRNFEKYAEEMLRQTAGLSSVPWQRALLALLEIVDRRHINWYLAGSAALAVRGVDVVPRDLDLVLDDAGAQGLGELLLDYLVEPVRPSPGWISNWFGRAFLHACIDWVGGVHDSVDEPDATDFGPTAARRLEVVEWQGREIRVAPLDLQLRVTERRGLTERVESIRRFLQNSR